MPEREYRVLKQDEPAARSEARRLAARESRVELDDVEIVGAAKLEDGGGTIGWRVTVRVP